MSKGPPAPPPPKGAKRGALEPPPLPSFRVDDKTYPVVRQAGYAGDERRVHPRYDVLAQVEIGRGAEVHILSVDNVSEGGFMLRSDDDIGLVVGDCVDVMLFLAEELGDDVGGLADVVRAFHRDGHHCFGMRFKSFRPGHKARLDAFIKRLRA